MLENELLDSGKWKNFIFDWWLVTCCDIIEIMATICSSKTIEMFATLRNLSICISVNEWTLNFIRTRCYFGLHLGWWTVLLNLAHWIFYSFPRLSKRKSCDWEFKWSRIRCFNDKESFHKFLFRLFNELVLLFLTQLFPKLSTPTTIIKACPTPLPHQNKYRWCPSLPRRNKCCWCPSLPRRKKSR